MTEKKFSKTPFKGSYRSAMFRILISTFFIGMASLGIFMLSFFENDYGDPPCKVFLHVQSSSLDCFNLIMNSYF